MHSYIQKIKLLVRYLFSGAVAALVNIVIFSFLIYQTSIWYIAASVISFCVSFVVSFYLQKYWTFQDGATKETTQQLMWYLIITGVNLVVNVVLMVLFVDGLGLHKIFAKVLTLGILACWSFFIYQRYIFTKKSST